MIETTRTIEPQVPTLGQRLAAWCIKKLIKVMAWVFTAPFRAFWALVKKL